MTKGKAFLIANLSLIFGLILANFLPKTIIVNDLLWFSLFIFCLIIIFFIWSQWQAYLILVCLFLLLGIWRFSIGLPQDNINRIWHYNNKTVDLIGVVSQEPDTRSDKVKLTIKTEQILLNKTERILFKQKNHDISGLILVTTELYPQYQYGDVLSLKCNLQSPVRFTDFAYDKYLARYNIYSVCYYPKINLLQLTNNSFRSDLINFKHNLGVLIDSYLPQPEASLGKAILLGYKKDLPKIWRDKFSKVGLSHIIAISGLHIGIIGLIILQILLAIGVNRKYVFYIASIILWLYIILINTPASAVRAGIMGQLILLAVHLGRLNKSINAVVFTASLMLLINPKIIYDIGWQLSFLAVLGIIYIYPLIMKLFFKIKFKIKYFSDIIAISLSAQIITWPIIAFNFSQISLIAPVANILVLWLLPILLICLLLSIILTTLLPFLTIILWLPSYLALHYIFLITDLLIKIPYSYLKL